MQIAKETGEWSEDFKQDPESSQHTKIVWDTIQNSSTWMNQENS